MEMWLLTKGLFVGILNHAWDGWRNETVVENYDLPFVDATLSE